ncbi:hypothetical protein H8958_014602 [Nasalis larvatus]
MKSTDMVPSLMNLHSRKGKDSLGGEVEPNLKRYSNESQAQELKSLFEKKSLKEKPPISGKQSILSVRLEQCPLQLNNPFNEYSKFDGKGHVGTTATKKIDVYLPLHSSQDRLLPMTVVTMASARVQDLIGLICWQYTSEGREPKLNDNVSAYCLHIAEDDGEVDTDFPPLDSNEPIHKFGFSTLALVEKYSSPGLTSKESLFVRINAAHGFSLIQVDNTKVTMKEILLKAVKRRKGSQKVSAQREAYFHIFGCPQYRLEKQSEPNVAVDLDSTLESQSAWEFCLVRENSSRADGVFEEDSQIDIATVQDMLSSHHYKSFKVSMIHRLRFTTDVQLVSEDGCPCTVIRSSSLDVVRQPPQNLFQHSPISNPYQSIEGISGDKVEIDPVTNQKASTKFWIKQKPISIDSDLLCACDLAEEKSPSHAIFKLTYLSNHDYKHLYFESDAATVNEIVLKHLALRHLAQVRAFPATPSYALGDFVVLIRAGLLAQNGAKVKSSCTGVLGEFTGKEVIGSTEEVTSKVNWLALLRASGDMPVLPAAKSYPGPQWQNHQEAATKIS